MARIPADLLAEPADHLLCRSQCRTGQSEPRLPPPADQAGRVEEGTKASSRCGLHQRSVSSTSRQLCGWSGYLFRVPLGTTAHAWLQRTA